MKALTLTQPWASLVAIGAKRIETRSWATSYRGPLAIHAAKCFPRDAQDFARSRMVLDLMRPYVKDNEPYIKQFPRGLVLATAWLIDCTGTWNVRNVRTLTEQEEALGNYEEGRFGFLLGDVLALKVPVPAKGALGLWEWKTE